MLDIDEIVADSFRVNAPANQRDIFLNQLGAFARNGDAIGASIYLQKVSEMSALIDLIGEITPADLPEIPGIAIPVTVSFMAPNTDGIWENTGSTPEDIAQIMTALYDGFGKNSKLVIRPYSIGEPAPDSKKLDRFRWLDMTGESTLTEGNKSGFSRFITEANRYFDIDDKDGNTLVLSAGFPTNADNTKAGNRAPNTVTISIRKAKK